jgi:hypothetical protein
MKLYRFDFENNRYHAIWEDRTDKVIIFRDENVIVEKIDTELFVVRENIPNIIELIEENFSTEVVAVWERVG